MTTRFSDRLSVKLTRNTIIVALLLGLVLSVIQISSDYADADRAIDESVQAIIAISSSPASRIAYNIDAKLAEELLEGLLQHPSIIDAEIIDGDSFILAKQSRPLINSPYRWMSDLLFGTTRQYSHLLHIELLEDIDLGYLNVVADTYDLGSDFIYRASLTVVSGVVKSLSLSAIFLLIFYWQLTRPLVGVAEGIRDVDSDAPEKTRLPVPSSHENDEIGLLVASTNRHLATIESHVEQRRNMEAKLKDYSEKLEQLVEGRTRELTAKNNQLMHSNKELVDARERALDKARARADFLAGMSHEIRTPFNGILGMVGLCLEDDLSERQRQQLQVAHQSGTNLLQLLNDVLDISKVEAGKLSLEEIPFDLRDTIEQTVSLMAQQAQSKQVEISSQISPSFPECFLGDPTRLRQIFSNLVANAVKFTEKGEVTVMAHYEKGRYGNQNVVIEVVDTGIGIPASAIDKVFEPFSQANDKVTRTYGGTGLGLTLSQQLCLSMNGSLQVKSREGRGSTFCARIPLQTAHTQQSFTDSDRHFDLSGRHIVLLCRQFSGNIRTISQHLDAWGGRCRVSEYTKLEQLQFDVEQYDEHDVFIVDDMQAITYLRNLHHGLPVRFMYFDRHASLPPSQHEFLKDSVMISAPVTRQKLVHALSQLGGQTPQSSQRDERRMQPSPQSSRGHVLVVEDNQVNQMVAQAIINKLGYDVALAKDGRDAISKVREQRFDLVLMDCNMPIMDGYEATQSIRAYQEQSASKRTPIIAVTASVVDGEKERCMKAGMDDFITKPYQKEKLMEMLTRWIQPSGEKTAETG